MTQHEEQAVIKKALKSYREKYKADYYCVILTPTDDKKVTIPGNHHISQAFGDEAGKTISDFVEREILLKPLKRRKK